MACPVWTAWRGSATAQAQGRVVRNPCSSRRGRRSAFRGRRIGRQCTLHGFSTTDRYIPCTSRVALCRSRSSPSHVATALGTVGNEPGHLPTPSRGSPPKVGLPGVASPGVPPVICEGFPVPQFPGALTPFSLHCVTVLRRRIRFTCGRLLFGGEPPGISQRCSVVSTSCDVRHPPPAKSWRLLALCSRLSARSLKGPLPVPVVPIGRRAGRN